MSRDGTIGKIIRKADVILIVLILCIALILMFAQTSLFTSAYSETAKVEVTLDGKHYGTYPLGTPRDIAVDDDYDNIIAIGKDKNGKVCVYMKDANCPGLDCVHHAPIALGGQSIVCLPAKLVVEIVDGKNEIDGYTY